MTNLVSLGELKALGALVRWQEIPERLQSSGYQGTSYPCLRTWAQPAPWVDVCLDERWQRVAYAGLSADGVDFITDGTTRSIPMKDFTVAPAGYYSDVTVPPDTVERAELGSRYEIFGHEIHSGKVTSVEGPYITFEVLHYPTASRWVDDFWKTRRKLHFKDPRVEIPGMVKTPYNRPIAVSHRWLQDDVPDRRGEQFQELLDWSQRMGIPDTQAFMIDYSSLPQRPRNDQEEALFRTSFAACQNMFTEYCMALSTGSSDYGQRAWCMLECMLAAKANALINLGEVSEEVRRANDQARGFAETVKWKFQAMQKHRFDARNFLKDQQAVIAYVAHQAASQKVKDRFVEDFLVTHEDDRHLILKVLDDEFFAM